MKLKLSNFLKLLVIYKIIFLCSDVIFAEDSFYKKITSRLLNFPSDNLSVFDLTEAEQTRHAEKIFKAILINSNLPNTFKPIHITIAKKDALLSEKDKELVETLKAAEVGEFEISEKARDYLGYKKIYDDVEGLFLFGERFLMFQEISDSQPNVLYKMAYSCLIYPPGTDLEIRISILENTIKNPVPGGEIYYEYFRDEATADEIYGDVRQPEFDFKTFFADFGRTLVESEMVKNIIAEQSNQNTASDGSTAVQQNGNLLQHQNAETGTPEAAALTTAAEQNKSINFLLLLAGLAAIFLVGFYFVNRSQRWHK